MSVCSLFFYASFTSLNNLLSEQATPLSYRNHWFLDILFDNHLQWLPGDLMMPISLTVLSPLLSGAEVLTGEGILPGVGVQPEAGVSQEPSQEQDSSQESSQEQESSKESIQEQTWIQQPSGSTILNSKILGSTNFDSMIIGFNNPWTKQS